MLVGHVLMTMAMVMVVVVTTLVVRHCASPQAMLKTLLLV